MCVQTFMIHYIQVEIYAKRYEIIILCSNEETQLQKEIQLNSIFLHFPNQFLNKLSLQKLYLFFSICVKSSPSFIATNKKKQF